ncbi:MULTISPECIES: DUF4118 domain-containing protein [unclassified Duganella]|uniref:DUF4118 domain-containing protein n=1 Tax=unclassified Duganella TaxID=2636909 RepID=UPI000E354978|nr:MULTISPECIES: DUF4118 domain-containing protein [unclassified Duganella]RFP18851.1 DUF4118 domain-containing protein [Duganella sp. BJB475]RFP35515.1 DUF4118 domain-containing protein [Duganella sp. BJB476]
MSYLNKNSKKWTTGTPVFRLGMGLLLTLAALAIRKILHPFIEPHVPFLFFVIASITTEFFFGITAAFVSMIIGMSLGLYFFMAPYGTLSIPTGDDFIAMASNLIIAIITILLLEYLRRSHYSTKLMLSVVNSQRRSLLEVYNQLLFQQRKSHAFVKEVTSSFAAMDQILLLMPFGHLPYRMPAWHRITGGDDGEDKNLEWHTMIHPDEDAMMQRELSQAEHLPVGSKKTLRFRVKTALNDYQWVDGILWTIHYRQHWRMTVLVANNVG